MNKKIITVVDEMVNLRVDKALALDSEIQSRSRASYLIDSGHVLVNNKPVKSSYILKANDIVEISIPEATPSDLVPYDFKLDILFEDDDVIVVNKPSGLVVHPAAGHAQDTLVNALLAHTKNLSMKFGEERPGIVHRLDKETSGILVVAKNDFAHESLTQQFKDRTTHRVYYAVCLGTAKNLSGTIQSFLTRHPVDRKKYASVIDSEKKKIIDPTAEVESGKWAVTRYEVLKRHSGLSYLKLKLETGRTHQIRVHTSEHGLPIAGDVLYGADKKIKNAQSKYTQDDLRKLNRFLLHAAELAFDHPKSNERMTFKVDWPEADLTLIKKWGLV